MDIKRHFDYNPTLDLTAAHIGINKWDWKTIDEENEDKAKEIMKEKSFDVLPVLDTNGKATKYFSTRVWNNYDKLNLNHIDQASLVYYRLSLNDLVSKFNEEKKHYYFLTNYKDILGLVSYVNLNCQAVYNYLFQIIADLERSIAYMLKEHLNQDEIIDTFKTSSDSHLNKVAKTFEEAMASGKDSTIFEHMYLQTIGITLSKFSNKLPDDYKKLNKYSPKFSPTGIYGEFRNKIMHPVRPILNDDASIAKIDTLLKDYSEIKELLR
jgi:hypothetical protein